MTRRYIHDYEKRWDDALALVKRDALPEECRKAILRFLEHMQASSMSKPRLIRYTVILRSAAKLLAKPFEQATKEDVVRAIAEIERRPYSEWTKVSFRTGVKRFYKWLLGNDEEFPAQVKWVKTHLSSDRIPLPRRSELVSEEDVKRLLACAANVRDRAFIALLWDTGARIGELGTLTLQDVTFDKFSARVQVHGKTGARQVRVIEGTPYLARWLDQHPRRDDPSAPLWVSMSNLNRGAPLEYGALRKILRVTFERAGVRKKSNPHSFRHARATHLAKHLSEFQLKERFGWAPGSDQARTYVHLSGRDSDEALFKLYGIKAGEQQGEEHALKPRACTRCDTLNTHEAKFCRKCGGPLELAAALAVEEKKTKAEALLLDVLEDETVKRVLQEALVRRRLLTLGVARN